MTHTTLQERVKIATLAQAGLHDRAIAEQVGWRVGTVRKWRRRAQQAGRAGLQDRRGRPPSGALRSFGPAIRERLVAWRAAHPGWGPKTLHTELIHDPTLRSQAVPSQRSIARWLREQGLSRRYERHRALPEVTPCPPLNPHEEWELDARGHARVADVGVVALLNLNDVCSRLRLLSYPCVVGRQRATRHPDTTDYQLLLRLAFTEWGRPNRLAVDRDSVFHDNTCPSPFPTRFHLWLLGLGCQLVFGRPNQPRDQAVTERSHQLWAQQVLQGQTFASLGDLQRALQRRRHFLNALLPCRSLAERPPLVAFPHAAHSARPYRPEWEPALFDPAPIQAYLAQGEWFRKASAVGSVSLGHQIYCLGPAFVRQEVAITFDPTDYHLLFQTADLAQFRRLPIKGLTVPDLVGDVWPLLGPEPFQLALPFTAHEARLLRFSDTLVA